MGKNKKRYKKKLVNALEGVRERSLEQGFYDGRFRSQRVPDKKKKNSKEAAKKYNFIKVLNNE